MNKQIFKSTSPQYEFWNSNQDIEAEEKRILKLNPNGIAADLFKHEPYKWEILYQSILLELRDGKLTAIKGLSILLNSLKIDEKNKIINKLKEKNLLPLEIIEMVSNNDFNNSNERINLCRYMKILIAIFTNPYGIQIKAKRKRIYEHSGFLFNKLRKENI